MERSPKKRNKGRYTRREEGNFAVGSISNKGNTDINNYTDCQSANDIYLFNYPFLLFFIPFFSSVYFADRKKTVTLTNALVVIFTEPLTEGKVLQLILTTIEFSRSPSKSKTRHDLCNLVLINIRP